MMHNFHTDIKWFGYGSWRLINTGLRDGQVQGGFRYGLIQAGGRYPFGANALEQPMTVHTLDPPGRLRLKRLVGSRADQIVLDVNAVYIVGPIETIEVRAECVAADSPVPRCYDEVFPISVAVLKENYTFDRLGEAGMAYRVVAEAEVITQVDVVRVGVRFPDEIMVPASETDHQDPGLNIVDCGVFIHTARGILVAFQRHPGFGFHWGSHLQEALQDPHSAKALLPSGYELIQVAASSTSADAGVEALRGGEGGSRDSATSC